MNKRALFVFEPAMVIMFLVVIFAATTVILQAKSGALQTAYGGNAQLIAGAYLIGENQQAVPRMLDASYAITESAYLLASGGGKRLDPGMTPEGCQWLWESTTTAQITSAASTIPELNVVAEEFKQLLLTELDAPVPYQFSLADPFTVIGIPLQPEQIEIENPHTKLPTGFRNERLGFTVQRSYPFATIYPKLKQGMEQISACATTTTANARALCVDDAIKKLNAEPRVISWSATHNTDTLYRITAVHEYQFPYCLNKPTTRALFQFPSLATS